MLQEAAALALLEPSRWCCVPLGCFVEPALTRLAELIVSLRALRFVLIVLKPGLNEFLDQILSLVRAGVLVVLLLTRELKAGLLATLLLQRVVEADHLRR